jgi:replicative DNA helicase
VSREDSQFQLEQSVIGCVLVRPDCLALLPTIELDDFQHMKGRSCWEAIRRLEAQGRPIDTVTLGDELDSMGKLDAVGWDYIGSCSLTPSAANATEYARRLRDARVHREVMDVFGQIQEASKASTGAELLTLALAGLSRLDAEQPEDASTIGDIVKRRVKQLEEIAAERLTGQRILTGYPTGVERLDEKIGGWPPGIVSIVAARPAMGKSSLGLATADACTAAGFGVHLFSLEDTEQAYADRTIARTSGVDAEKLRNADINRTEVEEVGKALRKLGQRKGWLVDGRSGVTADEIVRSVRRRKRENGTKVVIVDYIQLVKRPPRVSPHEALSDIITTFADAAKHDKLAYVVMSQLNREIEKRDDKRPQLSDLRESGSLEERSKCVVGVYRGSVYHSKPKDGVDFDSKKERAPAEEEFHRQVQLLVLKNSNGRTGKVTASWSGPTTTIR